MRLLRDRPLGVKLLLLAVGLFALTLVALIAGSAHLTYERMVADRVGKVRALVEVTHEMAELLDSEVADGRLTRAQAIDRFRTLVYGMRYDGVGYLFAYGYDGAVIVLGNNPGVEGENRWNLRDTRGALFIQELIATARSGGGTVEDLYPRGPNEPPLPKRSFVMAFTPWNMLIGTGFYVDDLDAVFRAYLFKVGLVLLGALAGAGGLAVWIGRAVTASMSERRAAEAKIIHLAHHDTLTDLPNRALLQDRLAQAVWRAGREPASGIALLLCDLDRFKDVNDTFGHPAGDDLLRQAAQRMRDTMRTGDILARLGGDEFAFIQMACQHTAQAESLAARIVDVVARPFTVQDHVVNVGVSIGIALAPVDATDPVDLMKHADTALYVSKQGGRGMATVYRPEMSEGMQERHELEADLRRAIGGGEFELHYQPLVALRTRRIIGCEALVRWRHPTRGLVPPQSFIQVAEECGLLVQLGESILRRACLDAAGWGVNIRVAVNVSSQQVQAPGFLAIVRSALADAALPPDRLDLEITETVMLNDGEHVRCTLKELRVFGVHISLDDFGTGYSSLSYLQKFPIDKIKIDRSFVHNLGMATEAEAIVRAVANLGATLGIRTLAEGIETEDQAARVLGARCDEGQGYLFSRPVPGGLIAEVIGKLGAEPPVPAPSPLRAAIPA